jgi:hypothetical protein
MGTIFQGGRREIEKCTHVEHDKFFFQKTFCFFFICIDLNYCDLILDTCYQKKWQKQEAL